MGVGTRGDAARITRTAHFSASIFALDGFNSFFKKKGGKGQVGDDGNCGCRQVHYKLDAVLERQEPTVSVSKLKKAQSAQMNTCRCNI